MSRTPARGSRPLISLLIGLGLVVALRLARAADDIAGRVLLSRRDRRTRRAQDRSAGRAGAACARARAALILPALRRAFGAGRDSRARADLRAWPRPRRLDRRQRLCARAANISNSPRCASTRRPKRASCASDSPRRSISPASSSPASSAMPILNLVTPLFATAFMVQVLQAADAAMRSAREFRR